MAPGFVVVSGFLKFIISQYQKTAANASFSEADRCFCSGAQFGVKVFHDSAHHLTDGFVNLVIGQRFIVGLEMQCESQTL